MKILLTFCLSLLFTLTAMAQKKNCDSILIQNVDFSSLNNDAKVEYLNLIDEKMWTEHRTDNKFRAELTQQIGKVPPFSASDDYSTFDSSRRDYFQRINYNSKTHSAFQAFHVYLSDKQVQAWADCMRDDDNPYGLFIRERDVHNDSVLLEVIWIKPPGLPEGPVPVSGSISGGKVIGWDTTSGNLFPPGQKFEQGALMLNIRRSDTESLSIAISAGGYSKAYSLSSRMMDSVQVASPIGTIIASMLPPFRYADVSGDQNGFDPKTSAWALADGRSVAGSTYAKFIGPTTPDLRGQFLRGLNAFESTNPRPSGGDPDTQRVAGSSQSDEFKQHDHGGGDHTHATAIQNGAKGGWNEIIVRKIGTDFQDNPEAKTSASGKIIKPEGGPETRPVNVAIYYYIRIN